MNRLYLDIETNMAHDKIWCCCVMDSNGSSVTYTEPKDFLQKAMYQADEVVAHNGIGFDFPILEKLWGITIPPEKQRDTLVLSRLYNPNLAGGHSLEAWGERLKGVKKIDFTDFDGGLTDEMIEYCMRDVELLKRVDKRLDDLLGKWKNAKQSIELEHKVAQIMQRQHENGFLLDVPYAQTMHCNLTQRMAQIEEELQKVFPPITTERYSEKTGKRLKDNVEVFNVGSRRQIAKRLQGLGVEFDKLTDNGNIIVDEPVLEMIDLPEAKLCLEYLTIQKRLGMVDSWLKAVHDDNRVRGKVITNGAITGRMTHSKPNMGQITSEKASRECWTVPAGYKLVGCDLAGIELRCLAHYMQDAEWTRELLEGDIHTKNQHAAGLDTRAQAKTFCYAILYGAGAVKVGSIVGKGRNEGKKMMDKFLSNTPSLKSLKEKVDRIAVNGVLPAIDGRRLIVRHQHAALNTLLQSCGAIITKQWLVECHRMLDEQGLSKFVKQVACVHDEIEMEVKEEYAEQVARICEQSATVAGEVLGIRLPIEAEAKIGRTWYDVH